MKAVCIKQFISEADNNVAQHNQMKISVFKVYGVKKPKNFKESKYYVLSKLHASFPRNLNSWTCITDKELEENFRMIEE
jgi:hypothetical protein